MLSIEDPQPRSQEPIHSLTLNTFTDRPSEPISPPNRNKQHVLWSALCSNYRNEVCICRVLLNVTEAEFDRYSDRMRCGVITIHSPRPLWLTNTLHSDRQIWLPQKLGHGMPHIQSAWERGIWGCGTEGMILTWAHFSHHPPSIYPSNTPPESVCYQLPTTRSPNKTTLMFSNTQIGSLELIYKLPRKHYNPLGVSIRYFYTMY